MHLSCPAVTDIFLTNTFWPSAPFASFSPNILNISKQIRFAPRIYLAPLSSILRNKFISNPSVSSSCPTVPYINCPLTKAQELMCDDQLPPINRLLQHTKSVTFVMLPHRVDSLFPYIFPVPLIAFNPIDRKRTGESAWNCKTLHSVDVAWETGKGSYQKESGSGRYAYIFAWWKLVDPGQVRNRVRPVYWVEVSFSLSPLRHLPRSNFFERLRCFFFFFFISI